MHAAWSWRAKVNRPGSANGRSAINFIPVSGLTNSVIPDSVIGEVRNIPHLNCCNPYTPRHTSHTVVVASPGEETSPGVLCAPHRHVECSGIVAPGRGLIYH